MHFRDAIVTNGHFPLVDNRNDGIKTFLSGFFPYSKRENSVGQHEKAKFD